MIPVSSRAEGSPGASAREIAAAVTVDVVRTSLVAPVYTPFLDPSAQGPGGKDLR